MSGHSLYDPDEALKRIRSRTAEILDDGMTDALVSEDLAALVRGMDEWLCGGGFPPKAWNPKIYSADPFSGPAVPST